MIGRVIAGALLVVALVVVVVLVMAGEGLIA